MGPNTYSKGIWKTRDTWIQWVIDVNQCYSAYFFDGFYTVASYKRSWVI